MRLSYGALRSLTVFIPFYYVCHVLLRLSRRVKFIDIKWHIMGDKFLHIGAVTIVNNTDHTLHYAIEEELQSRTFLILNQPCSRLLRSAVLIISKDLFVYKRKKMCFILYGVYVSSVADLDRPKERVTPWSKRN